MFTFEDYDLITKVLEKAIENVDAELFDELLVLRGKIADEVMKDDKESTKLMNYFDVRLDIAE